jgi:hypothetical protein
MNKAGFLHILHMENWSGHKTEMEILETTEQGMAPQTVEATSAD